MAKSALPIGWAKTTIREVTDHNVQATGPNGSGTFTYVDISSIDNRRKCVVDPKVLTTEEAPSRAKQLLRHNDTVVSMTRPNLNAVAIIRPELDGSIGSTGLQVLRPLAINPGWLYYLVQTTAFVEKMAALVQGALYPAVRPKDILDYEIPLAPENEQERIVSEIEKQFTRLDAATASLQQARKKLERYRSSILSAACEGRLVPTAAELATAENREYETGSQLLTRVLADRRARWEQEQLQKMRDRGEEPKNDNWKLLYREPSGPQKEDYPRLPEGWTWSTVDQLSSVVRGASPRPAGDPRYFGGTIPWITVGVLTADNQPYLRETKETVTVAGRDASRYVGPDTLLLTNSGATLGVPKITLIGGCINDGSVALLDVGYPLKLYLYYFLSTQTKKLRAINQGAAQPNLNTSIVKSIEVPLPPLEEQTRILQMLERQLSVVDELLSLVSGGQKRAANLRQSILREAFNGRLTPQNPDDEPASILLNRIRMERAQILAANAGQTRNKRGRSTSMSENRTASRRALTTALNEAKSALTPEQLFTAAGHGPETIDEFYAELKSGVAAGQIEEVRSGSDGVLLRAKRA